MLKSKTVDQLVRNNPNIKPSEVQSIFVLSAFQEQKDWADVESEAASTIDRKWISNVRHDQFFTYKINDRRGNPDQPSSFF